MFTTLSRRGSRVKPSYICSSCLSTLFAHSDLLPLASNDRIPARHFHSTTPRLEEETEGKKDKEFVYEGNTITGSATLQNGRKKRSMKKKSPRPQAHEEKKKTWEKQLRSLKAAFVAEQEPASTQIVQKSTSAQTKDTTVESDAPGPAATENRTKKSGPPGKEDDLTKENKVVKEKEINSKKRPSAKNVIPKEQEDNAASKEEAMGKRVLQKKQGKQGGTNENKEPTGDKTGVSVTLEVVPSKNSKTKVSASNKLEASKVGGIAGDAATVVPRDPRQSIRKRRISLRDARRKRTVHDKAGVEHNSQHSKGPEGSTVRSVRSVSRGQRGVIDGPGEGMTSGTIETINTADLKFQPVERKLPPVPRLSYGLDRVLFNPGVYQLQDPRSRVYNFDPYLQTIMPVNEFDFTLLKRFITSSRDQTLLQTTKDEGKKYTGSTSSMTSALAHFHYLLSQWRPINVGNLSKNFPNDSSNFTIFQRIPAAIFLRWKDGVYAIDADKQYDTASVLSMLGQSMEKLLTLSTDEFEKYRKNSSDPVSEESRNESEAYHYSTMGDFLMRSQLDAYDPRIPGSGMFDLKTRAVVSVRMDTGSYEQGRGYEIRSRHGQWESFEREYYDMIRAAFMKYSLQVRIGRMDGIFVAFHNTERIFGFQYISLPEMDHALHGTDDTTLGDSEFKVSLQLFNRVLDRATAKWPEQSLRLFVETRGKEDEPTYMYIFAEPMDEEKIDDIQNSNKAKIEEFEGRVLGLNNEKSESLEEVISQWKTLQAKVQNSMARDEKDAGSSIETEEVEELVDVDDKAPPSPWNDDSEGVSPLTNTQTSNAAQPAGTVNQVIEKQADQDSHSSDRAEMLENINANVDSAIPADVTADIPDTWEEPSTEKAAEMDDAERQSTDVLVANATMETTGDKSEVTKHGSGEVSAEIISTEATNDVMEDILKNEPKEETSEFTKGSTHTLVEQSINGIPEDLTQSAARQMADEAGNNPSQEFIDEDSGIEGAVRQGLEGSSYEENKSLPSDNTEARQSELTTNLSAPANAAGTSDEPNPDLLAMYLTVRSKVNGHVVQRPENLQPSDDWTVEYALAEIVDPKKAEMLYKSCKQRRKAVHTRSKNDKDSVWHQSFMASIRRYTAKGRAYRKQVDAEQAAEPVKVLTVKPEDLNNWEKWSESGRSQEERRNSDK
jgi:hypothetical protein